MGFMNQTNYESFGNIVNVLNITLITFSIIGNGIILILTWRHRTKSRIRATYYILNIVVIDLLITCIFIPININRPSISWGNSSFLCKMMEGVKFILFSSNVNITAALSICRWQVTQNKYIQGHIKRLDKRYIAIAWGVAMISGVPAFFVNQLEIITNDTRFCGEPWHNFQSPLKINIEILYQIFVNLVHFSIPVCIICFAYSHIWYTVRISRYIPLFSDSSLKTCNNVTTILTTKSKKVMLLSIILMINFIICRLPIHIWYFVEMHNSMNIIHFWYLRPLLQWQAISYCCLNPIVVLISDSVYQKHLYNDLQDLYVILGSYFRKSKRNSCNFNLYNRPRTIYVRPPIINCTVCNPCLKRETLKQSYMMNPRAYRTAERIIYFAEIRKLEREIQQYQRRCYL